MEHLKALLTEMVEEEDNLKEKLLGSIRENLEKLRLLRVELKLKADLKASMLHILTHLKCVMTVFSPGDPDGRYDSKSKRKEHKREGG